MCTALEAQRATVMRCRDAGAAPGSGGENNPGARTGYDADGDVHRLQPTTRKTKKSRKTSEKRCAQKCYGCMVTNLQTRKLRRSLSRYSFNSIVSRRSDGEPAVGTDPSVTGVINDGKSKGASEDDVVSICQDERMRASMGEARAVIRVGR